MGLFKRLRQIIKSNFYCNENLNYQNTIYNDTSLLENNPEEYNNKEAQYYANLELHYGASFKEIKQAHRSLLKKYHPDLHNGSTKDKSCAEKITQKLNEAFNYFEDKLNKGEL